MKRIIWGTAALGLVLSACGPKAQPTTTTPVAEPSTSSSDLTVHRHHTPTPTPTPVPTVTTPGRGTCHYRQVGSDPLMVLPDLSCTPGVRNPDVTEATIHSTMCVAGWTGTIRPPQSVTSKIKLQSLIDYGRPSRDAAVTELDHMLPLELGGSPADPRNLWVEPNYAVPHPTGFDHNPKDPIEFKLRNAVCSGKVQLAVAQNAMLSNWTTALSVLGLG